MGSPNNPYRACRDPPNSSIISNSKKATQILGRLFRSFSDSYTWSMLTIWIIAAMIFTATILPALGSSMSIVALENKGKNTAVIEIKAVFPNGWDPRYYYTFLNNQSLAGSFDAWPGYWRNCFTESDVNEIADLNGVETVVRVLDVDAYGRPENLTSETLWALQNSLETFRNTPNSFLERESYRKLAASWNMTASDYLTMTLSYSNMVMRCIDTKAVDGWDLGFGVALNKIAVGDLDNSIAVNQLMQHEMLSPFVVGQKAYFLMGQMGEYSPGSAEWSVEMAMNDTNVTYDYRHLYKFNVVSSFPGSSSPSGKAPGIVMDLKTMLHILETERNPAGAALPIYTSLLVKPTSQDDYAKLENKLRGLYPDKVVSRAGTAPTTISDRASQVGISILGMSYLYTSIIAILGALILLIEALRNRKMLWLLKSRGWTKLDILSYNLARSAVIGVVGGCLALLVMTTLKPLTADFLLPKALIDASPSIASTVQRVLNESLSGYTIYTLPIIGITATVLCSVPATIFFLLTKPKENLYDSLDTNVK